MAEETDGQQHADVSWKTDAPRLGAGFENQVLTVIPQNVLEHARRHPLLEPLFLTDVGYFPRAQYHYRERREGCGQHILIYCIKGKGYVEAQGRTHIITKNEVLIIPEGVAHAYGSAREADPWHIYWAHYTGIKARLYNPGSTNDVFVSSVPYSKFADLSRLFHSILDTLDRGLTLDNMIRSAHTFAYLLSELFFGGGVGTRERSAMPDHVDTAITYMQTRIQGNITLSELARRSNLSKGYLTQLFRERTGYSPIRYFINLKMQQACRLLDLTDMSVKQVAASLGYSDPYYFSRLFTQTIGMAPSAYRAIAKG